VTAVEIVPIHACNPGPMTGEGNWTFLVRGRLPTLIDAGTGEVRHLAAIEAALDGSPLAQVLVTHAHPDHVSGAQALRRRFDGVRFMKMPWAGRDARWPVPWQPLDDGAMVPAGDTSLQAVHTPGHAPDHLSFWEAGTRTLFCGDLVVKGSTVYIPSRLQGDLAAYLASLRRVLAMNPARLLPAHGEPIGDPAAILRAHIDHRLEREAHVVEALRAGDATADAIVARVYRGLKPSLVPLATESVEAHLVKLAREGRARRQGDAWHIIEP
jgi:glyoxylase-like metal-dependent hydrolase (beta-lactamase superfamily II)